MNAPLDLKTIQCPFDGAEFWKLCVGFMYEQISNPINHEDEEYPPKGMTDEMVFKVNVIAEALAYYFTYRWRDGGFEAMGVINTRQLLETLAKVYTRYVRQNTYELPGYIRSSKAVIEWAGAIVTSPEVWVFSCEDLARCGVHEQDSVQETEMQWKLTRVWTCVHNNLRNPPEPPPMGFVRQAVKVIHEIGIDDFMRNGPYDCP